MSRESLLQLKQEIANHYPDFQSRVTRAWREVLCELATVTADIAQQGPEYVPVVQYADLASLSPEQHVLLKRRGTFVVQGVVPHEEASQWRNELRDWITANPNAEGTPANNPQYFQIFYTKPQIRARAHPNVLQTQTWCNRLYTHSDVHEPVDLDTPLTYVDRFRMRQPGFAWGAHPPHMDGGAIERWRDTVFRQAFEKILSGDWRDHDPYHLKGRIGARTSTKGQPNQASIFRTFQGWLAVSETGPGEGTLRVFPDIILSSAYIMLRPFFTPMSESGKESDLDVDNWKFDLSDPTFHGVSMDDSAGKSGGARPFEFSPATHPHMRLDTAMVSVPRVQPGDMVFWQADVVHAVEKEHNGKGDSSVMYIPAVPKCPQNDEYVQKQAKLFEQGCPPPDFPAGRTELDYTNHATTNDVQGELGRRAMGLASCRDSGIFACSAVDSKVIVETSLGVAVISAYTLCY